MKPPGNETIVVRTPAPEGLFGEPEGEPTEREVKGCAVVPRGSDEAGGVEATVVSGMLVVAPAGTRLTSTDEVLIRGDERPWQVEGDPDAGIVLDRRARERVVKFAIARVRG